MTTNVYNITCLIFLIYAQSNIVKVKEILPYSTAFTLSEINYTRRNKGHLYKQTKYLL